MTLEWIEFFPDFFEADVNGKKLFVNWNIPGKFWEVYYEKNIQFVTGKKETAFEYAEFFARHRAT